MFIGAHMASLSCTGFDPLFYMHHAYIDCLWEEYKNGKTLYERENDYPSNGKTLLPLGIASRTVNLN